MARGLAPKSNLQSKLYPKLTPKLTPKLERTEISDLKLLLAMIKEFHRIDHLPYNQTKISRVLTQLIRNPSLGRAWKICIGKEIAGYAIITFGYSIEYLGRNAFLDELFVKEQFRGKGLGQEILKIIQVAVKIFKIKALHLEASRSNLRAIHLYKKIGFSDPDRVLMTYWLPR